MRSGTTVWRGVLIGVLLLPVNAVWVLQMEHITAYGPIPSTISLFFNVIFILFFLVLANMALRRLSPRLALTRAELIIIYVMLATSTSLAGLDGMQVLLPVMTHGFWFATPENQWDQMLRSAPPWLVVSDHEILYGYYNGSTTLYQWKIVQAWLDPVLAWTGFITILIFVMICISVIVRAQWAERERLAFPIIQLPLAITEPGTALWRNPLLWIGFAGAGAIDIINGLHWLYPWLPYISIAPTLDNYGANDLMRFLPDMPWAAIGWLPVTFYPAVIGLAFLVPLDLLFATVFFFFWWKAMFVLAAALGLSQGFAEELSKSVFPYHNEQMFGGYLAIAIGPLVVGRRYYGAVWRRIIGRASDAHDTGEGLSYRVAALGIVLGIALLVAFSIHAGLSPMLAVLFFIIFFVISIAVARVRAEFGSPVHDFHWAGPGQTITYVGGTANIRHRDLTTLSLLWWFNRAYRSHPIGNNIEGLQMASITRSPARAVVAAIVTASVLGTIAVFWGWLHYAYDLGVAAKWNASDARGVEMCTNLQSWIENPTQANFDSVFAIAAGFGITLLLAAVRTAYVGWPLHPVAYALSASWSIHIVWMPMFIAWVVKSALLRYGGLQAYRRALPLFFGLILGESVVGCAWPIIGFIFGVPTYSFWGL
ncbi:MAG: hypothetical protein JXA57_00815 [Armatimonadetes bacterium]|nr:hypothetical protein [Armatimonadota bacterium]